MANQVTPTPYFLSKAKRLKKKFLTLDNSLLDLERKLIEDPRIGESYGGNITR